MDFTAKNARMWSRLGPSGAVGAAAIDLGKKSDKVLWLTADLCFFSGLERFKTDYPDRIYNLGIAEQNMIGVAAGMAKEGFTPFVTTYASFAASRCLDQVRVNMSYMKLPIKLIGLTSGFGAGLLGATHMSIEDMAIMRSIPNITVLCPADCSEIIKCIEAASETEDPTYIRLDGPLNTPIIYEDDYEFKIGQAVKLKEGRDICIIATGAMVSESLVLSKILEEEGISCSVINMHTIKPLDEETVIRASQTHKLIVTAEEHNVFGGLGSAVCEMIANKNIHIPVKNIGIKDFFAKAGDYDYQLEQSGLKALNMKEEIINYYRLLFK